MNPSKCDKKLSDKYLKFWGWKNRCDLNQNVVNGDKVSVYPMNIYAGNTFPSQTYLCEYPRNSKTNYIYGRERDEHPEYSSRFSYVRNWNGYGVGVHNGSYLVSEDCAYSTEPAGVAPKRFYKEPYGDCFPGTRSMGYNGGQSQAYEDSLEGRNMRLSGC